MKLNYKFIHYLLFSLLLQILILQKVFAGAVVNYHGRILDPDGKPLEASQVTFKISIYSPAPEKCLLYEEIRVLNMTDSAGVFVIPVGDADGVRTATDPGLQLEKIFSNDPSNVIRVEDFPRLSCTIDTKYEPELLDQRIMNVSFNDHTGTGEQILPATELSFVPMALNAYNAQNFGGKSADKYLTVTSTASSTEISGSQYAELLNLANGTSSQFTTLGTSLTTTLQSQIDGKANLTGATFTGSITATGFFYSSDRRLKSNITQIENPLDKIFNLKGVEFDWKHNGDHDIGFIAQDVEKVVPNLVQTMPGRQQGLKNHKAVKYGNITALLVEAVKELYSQLQSDLQELRSDVENLKNENEKLKNEIELIKIEIQKIKEK